MKTIVALACLLASTLAAAHDTVVFVEPAEYGERVILEDGSYARNYNPYERRYIRYRGWERHPQYRRYEEPRVGVSVDVTTGRRGTTVGVGGVIMFPGRY